MNREYLRQAKLKREQLIGVCQNILTRCKSQEEIFDKAIYDKNITVTSIDQKQEWKKYVIPEIDEDYYPLKKYLDAPKTTQKMKTQGKLRNSTMDTNNPELSQSLFKSRKSINNTSGRLGSNIKNSQTPNTRLSIKLNEQSTEYEWKANSIINQEENSELERFKDNILHQNEKFLRREVRELQKLMREKYSSDANSKLQLEYCKEQLQYLRTKYHDHYTYSHCNNYVQEEISYLRNKFLDHYKKCHHQSFQSTQ